MKVEIFQEKLIEIAKTVVPYREISRHQGCIWWNEDCSKAKREFIGKKRIYNLVGNLHSLIEKNRAYAIFRKTVLEAKKNSWNNFINKLDFRKPTSKVYEFMKKMNNRATSGRSNQRIASDNKLLLTDDQKADAAAKFMSSTVGRGDPIYRRRPIWTQK